MNCMFIHTYHHPTSHYGLVYFHFQESWQIDTGKKKIQDKQLFYYVWKCMDSIFFQRLYSCFLFTIFLFLAPCPFNVSYFPLGVGMAKTYPVFPDLTLLRHPILCLPTLSPVLIHPFHRWPPLISSPLILHLRTCCPHLFLSHIQTISEYHHSSTLQFTSSALTLLPKLRHTFIILSIPTWNSTCTLSTTHPTWHILEFMIILLHCEE